jgi:hypothetical protein
MKADRESLEPAKWSTLAKTSDDSVIEVFSFILLVYYYSMDGVECRSVIPRMFTLFMYNRDPRKYKRGPRMAKPKARIRHKHFRLDTAKLSRVRKILCADTETETIDRALDFVLSEHRRNQLAWEANERLLDSGIKMKDVPGSLGTAIASRFKKLGLQIDIPKLRGHKIRPVSFSRLG